MRRVFLIYDFSRCLGGIATDTLGLPPIIPWHYGMGMHYYHYCVTDKEEEARIEAWPSLPDSA